MIILMINRDNLNPPNDIIVENLKMSVIATLIMEITRKLTTEDKRYVKSFCDKLIFNKKLQEAREKDQETIPSLIDYHLKNVDALRVSSVRNLPFPVKGKEKLLDWYNQTKRDYDPEKDGEKEKDCYFIYYFKRMLQDVVGKEQGIEKKMQQQQIQLAKLVGQVGVDGIDEGKPDLGQKLFADNETQDYEQSHFFMQLIQTFELINYYNLILN